MNNTVLSNIATFLATHGVAPEAYIYVAHAALVMEDNLAALGDTLFITRLPATYNECGRLIAEAVAHNAWAEVGVLAHTKPTKHRPGTSYKASEGEVTLYGRPYRAGRWCTPARRINGNSSAWNVTSRPRRARSRPQRARLSSRSIFCRADAEAAAATLRAVPTAYHLVDVTVEERPIYGRGRRSSHKPRTIKTMHYRLKTTIKPDAERIRRREDEAGLLRATHQRAHGRRTSPIPRGDILTVDKEQHGTEQNYGFLKDPVIMNSLFLKKPARIESLRPLYSYFRRL